MEELYQGNHWTERDGATAKEDEAALPERVCLGALDKHGHTLRIQGMVNMHVSQRQVYREIKRIVHGKFTGSEEAKEANRAGCLQHDVGI